MIIIMLNGLPNEESMIFLQLIKNSKEYEIFPYSISTNNLTMDEIVEFNAEHNITIYPYNSQNFLYNDELKKYKQRPNIIIDLLPNIYLIFTISTYSHHNIPFISNEPIINKSVYENFNKNLKPTGIFIPKTLKYNSNNPEIYNFILDSSNLLLKTILNQKFILMIQH